MSKKLKSCLAVSLIHLLGWLPLTLLHLLALLMGRVLAVLPNTLRYRTRTNINRCLPHWSLRQQRQLVRRSLQHTAMAALEMGMNWGRCPTRGLARIRTVQGSEVLQQAQSRGGVLLLTPHLGNWELFAAWAAANYTLTALYKPARLQGLDRLMHAARSRAGMNLAPASTVGVIQLKRALAREEMCLLLPDQEPPLQAGTMSYFFGQPAHTMKLAAQLVAAGKLSVVLGYARRLGPGRGFSIYLQDITVQVEGDNLTTGVQAINNQLQWLIMAAPEQYQWEYHRFKQTLPQ